MHDTALQETGTVTFCAALAMWLRLRASKLNRNIDWFLAGVALGAIPLIRAMTRGCGSRVRVIIRRVATQFPLRYIFSTRPPWLPPFAHRGQPAFSRHTYL